jgi:hypothetical protein
MGAAARQSARDRLADAAGRPVHQRDPAAQIDTIHLEWIHVLSPNKCWRKRRIPLIQRS